MKIYTEVVYQMTAEGMEEISSKSYEYEGPVSEAKGGGTPAPPPPDLSGTLDEKTRRLYLTDPNAGKKSEYSYDFTTGDVYLNDKLKFARTDAEYQKTVQPYIDDFIARKDPRDDFVGNQYILGDSFTSIGGLTTGQNQLREDVNTLQQSATDVSGLKEDVLGIQSNLGGFEDKLKSNISTTKKIGTEFDTFRNDYTKQQEDYNDRFNKLTTGIGSLTDDYSDLSDSVNGLTDNVGTLNTDVTALKKGVGSAVDSVSDLTSGLSSTNSTVQDLQVGLGTLGADQESMADVMGQFQENTANFSEGVLDEFGNIDTRITGVESDLTDIANKPSYTGISNAFSSGMTLGTANPYLSAYSNPQTTYTGYSNPYSTQNNPYSLQNNPYVQNNYNSAFGSGITAASNLMNKGFSSFNNSPFFNLMNLGG